MSSVPERRKIDRTKAPDRDNPVIAALTDDQYWAFIEVIARFVASTARRLDAVGITAADIEAHGLTAARALAAEREGER
jgi:hypothetical protein